MLSKFTFFFFPMVPIFLVRGCKTCISILWFFPHIYLHLHTFMEALLLMNKYWYQLLLVMQYVTRYPRKSLRVLGSVGEPINPSAWRFWALSFFCAWFENLIFTPDRILTNSVCHRWFFNVVGGSRCPISDTWWQTETGGFMVFWFYFFVFLIPSLKYCYYCSLFCLWLPEIGSFMELIFVFIFPICICWCSVHLNNNFCCCIRLLHCRVPGHRSLVLQLSLSLVFRFSMK